PPLLELRFSHGRVVIEDEARPWRVLMRAREHRDAPLTRYGLPLEEAPLPDFRPFGIIDMAEAAIRDAMNNGPVVSGIPPALDALRVFAAIRKAADTEATVRLPLPAADEARRFEIP